ncbi:MAG TPA: hypothetical protein VHM20_00735, partial [Gammaproteobacteria bacterium]|nr:hypothetical protein [Gammaproteobacteria bacterium]
ESINQFIEKVPKSSSEKIASQKTQTQTQESKALKFFDWNKALKVAAKEIWDAISEDEQIKKKEQEVKDLEELKAFKSTYRRKF